MIIMPSLETGKQRFKMVCCLPPDPRAANGRVKLTPGSLAISGNNKNARVCISHHSNKYMCDLGIHGYL